MQEEFYVAIASRDGTIFDSEHGPALAFEPLTGLSGDILAEGLVANDALPGELWRRRRFGLVEARGARRPRSRARRAGQ
ncbi:MAG: hypothetical protein U5Q44_15000 [Dehalococcoidia bacterium]|nr:hypothetical protein [Dehalococcoidia bacterium]